MHSRWILYTDFCNKFWSHGTQWTLYSLPKSFWWDWCLPTLQASKRRGFLRPWTKEGASIINFWEIIWLKRIFPSKGYKNEFYIHAPKKILYFGNTGCLNMLCNTSNQHFLMLKWYSKQKIFNLGILSRGDLCLIHSFNFFILYTASTPQIFRVSKFKFFEAMPPQIWGYEIDKKL